MKANQEQANKNARQPVCVPPEASGDLTDMFKKIKKERGRPLFVLASDYIEDGVCAEIHSWKQELKKVAEGGNLDILVHSLGGDLHACYMVARILSRCLDVWEALVPQYAASGATLIRLGSSKIIMSEIARLSPLDPQVISKRREKFFAGERQSPLEAFQATRHLREFALTSLDLVMRFLLDQDVNPKLALETASNLSMRLVEPILGKIEPYDLGAFSLDSNVAKEYCKRVGSPTNHAKKTQRRVQPRILVEMYPAHEFVIDLEEARALQFEVSEPSSEIGALFDELRPPLSQVKTYLGFVD